MSDLSKKIKAAGIKLVKPTWVTRPELLLLPNVPKPLHQINPRTVLGARWWNETRQAAYRSTQYHCLACGVWKHEARGKPQLEGHEVYRLDYAKGRAYYVETVPVCPYCHGYIHDGRLRAMMEQGNITQSHYVAVIQHGDRVLREAGLKRLTYNERDNSVRNNKLAEWKNWRLIINVLVDGKRVHRSVKPKFKDFEDWQKAMQDDHRQDS